MEMKKEDLKTFYKEAEEQVEHSLKILQENYDRDLALFESGERDINKFDSNNLYSQYEKSRNLFWMYFDELKDEVMEMENLYNRMKKEAIWVHKSENDEIEVINLEDADVEHTISVCWKEFRKPFELTERFDKKARIKSVFRDILKNKVFNECKDFIKKQYALPIECKVLSLFEQWLIDFETLVTLTYSECNL